MPAETASTCPETIKKAADRHWEDANASISPVASPYWYTKRQGIEEKRKKIPFDRKSRNLAALLSFKWIAVETKFPFANSV
jgi:hypothetical protein